MQINQTGKMLIITGFAVLAATLVPSIAVPQDFCYPGGCASYGKRPAWGDTGPGQPPDDGDPQQPVLDPNHPPNCVPTSTTVSGPFSNEEAINWNSERQEYMDQYNTPTAPATGFCAVMGVANPVAGLMCLPAIFAPHGTHYGFIPAAVPGQCLVTVELSCAGPGMFVTPAVGRRFQPC